MARLGQQSTDKKSENGNLYYGAKDASYLKELSREAVEEHHNAPILYFAVDWENSRRNFYGELTTIKFKNPAGTQIRGTYKLEQGNQASRAGVPDKRMNLSVSVYVEQLKELGIDPQYGDYFGYGHRLYCIYDKTIDDVGPGNLLGSREKMRTDYMAFQDDDEVLQKDIWGDNLGTEHQISNGLNGEVLQ